MEGQLARFRAVPASPRSPPLSQVSRYRRLDPSGFHAAAKSVASGILVEFLADPEFVMHHLSDDLQATLRQALQTNKLHADLLIVAQRQVYDILEQYRLADFMATEPFQHFLQVPPRPSLRLARALRRPTPQNHPRGACDAPPRASPAERPHPMRTDAAVEGRGAADGEGEPPARGPRGL